MAHDRQTAPEYMESWREAAACRGTVEIDFFCDPSDRTAISAAKALCAGCPVAGECLTWAIETNQTDGIWGGHTPVERRSVRRRWLEEIRRAS
ncbi:MAG: WhiB family transcriptional regulator [Acidimicrobiia bacterium]